MKIEITEPNGKPYVTLSTDERMLLIKMNTYHNYMVHLDKRLIPHLIDALGKLQNEVLDNSISR